MGCDKAEPMAELSGVVTVGTTPVGACSVQFHPQDGGRPIAVTTAEGGSYRVTLPPGEYNVVVLTSYKPPAGWKEGDPLPVATVEIPKVYSLPSTTTLQVSVAGPEKRTKDLQL
ncbi:hypothetical protein [Aeoliella sp.]|uniref:hypothetical protein n=1 Tax=Aeoliella sp. TaxID=2795800 RepID=UPI003CCBAFD6